MNNTVQTIAQKATSPGAQSVGPKTTHSENVKILRDA